MNRREKIEFLNKNENAQKIVGVISDIQLIYKRVILGIIMLVLLILLIIDAIIIKQTIKTKDYPEATAVYVSQKDSDSKSFNDYIYTFEDKNGNKQEIVLSVASNNEPKEKIKIRYNEDNPKEYYEEGSTMQKKDYIWFTIKVLLMISFIGLFFNSKALRKMNISAKHKSH